MQALQEFAVDCTLIISGEYTYGKLLQERDFMLISTLGLNIVVHCTYMYMFGSKINIILANFKLNII